MNKEESEASLWDEADQETLIVSDSLRDRLDPKLFGAAGSSGISCTVYYETPSPGITGRLIGLKRSKKEVGIGIQIDAASIGEALSCPEFIRVVVSTDEKVLYEADFVESWDETSREVAQRDGRVELYISLAEHDT